MQNPNNERFEAIEVDIVSIKESIKQLSKMSLENQQALANLQISFDSELYKSILQRQFPAKKHLVTQLFTNASAARKEVESSKTPLITSYKFSNKWREYLLKLGAEVVEY